MVRRGRNGSRWRLLARSTVRVDEQSVIRALREPTTADLDKRALRALLVEANLDLVVREARRFRGNGIPFSDLVQEGALALVTASHEIATTVESGFKPFAHAAITRRLGELLERPGQQERSSGLLVNAAEPNVHEHRVEVERVVQLDALLGMLGTDEQRVLRLRFGFDPVQPRTLEAIAQMLGIQRWRVASIENSAMSSLRRVIHRLRISYPR
jgi:RNA polymerase sigma factor (sigma-70 family)